MHKYLSLTKTLIKCSVGMLTDGKNKKGMSIFLYSIIFISLIPIMFVVYAMVSATFEAMGAIDQIALPMGMMILMATFIIFFFSIFLIPSIFYFSSDNLTLLTLPLKPVHIIGAKFTVCVLYEYAFAAAILLPTYAAYIQYANPDILFYLSAFIVFILVPIFPLVCSTIFTILIMRFVPFFKNRDRFNLIAGFLALIIAFGFSFASGSFTNVGTQEELLGLFLQGNNSLLNLLSKLFPAISYFAKALCANDMISLIIALLITLASIFVLLTLGKYLYFKGAIGFGETTSSNKKLSAEDMQKANRSHSKIRTYALKEFKILIRTPVYFMNCISMCFIMPVLLFLIPIFDSSVDLQAGFDLVSIVDEIPNLIAYVILIGLGIGCSFGAINLISSTSISREGSHYEYMKYIPMSYREQVYAKTITGIILGILTIALSMIPIYYMFPVNIMYFVVLFVSSCVTAVLLNFIGIMIDMIHPKLVWEQEAAAVKQNMGGVITIFLGFALCAVFVFVCFIIPMDMILLGAISILIVMLVLTILSWVLLGKAAEKLIRNL